MKKISALIVLTFIISLSFAQVQRKVKTENIADSTTKTGERKKGNKANKKQAIRELDLTKEQKGKLKQQRQAAKDKKEAIQNNESLSAEQKEAKLKELQKEQAKSTMGILNEEQKEKMKKMRKEKKGKKMDESENN
jgi:hypothetical protein